MSLDDVRLNVYIDAIKRTRWFLLITTLLSCMLLLHMYLERFSYQEQQNIDTLKAREREDKTAKLDKLDKSIKEDLAKTVDDSTKLPNDKLEELITEYAQLKYNMTVFDNILKGVSIPNRSLPLLPMDIPGNDFLPIIGAMLLVFVIAVWLNIRSVLAAIHSLNPSNNVEMGELIRLHFTFTGLVDYSGIEKKIVPIVQTAAFILPCLSFFIAMGLDIYSIIRALINPKLGHAGPIGLFIMRTLIMSVDLILLFIFTKATIVKVEEIGTITDGITTKTP